MELENNFQMVHAHARKHLRKSAVRQKRNYDKNLSIVSLKLGSLVWLNSKARVKGRCPKLARAWEGPFVIRRKISDVNYQIQRGSNGKLKIVHYDRLKPYVGMKDGYLHDRGMVPAVAESSERLSDQVPVGNLDCSPHGGQIGTIASTPRSSVAAEMPVYNRFGRRLRAPKKYGVC